MNLFAENTPLWDTADELASALRTHDYDAVEEILARDDTILFDARSAGVVLTAALDAIPAVFARVLERCATGDVFGRTRVCPEGRELKVQDPITTLAAEAVADICTPQSVCGAPFSAAANNFQIPIDNPTMQV